MEVVQAGGHKEPINAFGWSLVINQPINQSTNQPINQSTNQPINQSTNQSVNQPTNQSINQPINQPTNQSTNHPINQSTNQPINQPPINQSIDQSINATDSSRVRTTAHVAAVTCRAKRLAKPLWTPGGSALAMRTTNALKASEWWLRSKLRRVVDGGRRRETAGDGGSMLLRVFRGSEHEQETRGVIGSIRKQ